MPFPSTLSTFNYPQATDRLNNPSHSALENSQSSAIGQIEAVIGTDASTLGTIIGDLRNPNSGGGGHVQAVNKGGTGLTSYAKGDLLVATSSSVIAKQAVSSTLGEVLTADPNQASGMKWAPTVSNKMAVNLSSVIIAAGQASAVTVLYASSIAGSVLGTSNAVRFTGVIQKYTHQSDFNLAVNYGNNVIASVAISGPTAVSVMGGVIEGLIMADGASNQKGYVELRANSNAIGGGALGYKGYAFSFANSSVNSSADQNLVITGQWPTVQTIASVVTGPFLVEKIA